mgnify:CR=1 FL=1
MEVGALDNCLSLLSAARRVESTESHAAPFEPTNLVPDPEVEENLGVTILSQAF